MCHAFIFGPLCSDTPTENPLQPDNFRGYLLKFLQSFFYKKVEGVLVRSDQILTFWPTVDPSLFIIQEFTQLLIFLWNLKSNYLKKTYLFEDLSLLVHKILGRKAWEAKTPKHIT